VLHEVFYADEVRSFDEVETAGAFEFKPIEVELADKLINELSVPAFDSSKFEDTYAARVRAAVEQKVAGQEVVVAAEAPKAQIVDLLEALKRSVAGLKKNDSEAQAAPKSEPSPGPKKAGPKPETAAAKKKSAG
jgi:DNA end-binding protein Ku